MAIERLDIESSADPLQIFLHQQRYDFVLSQLPQNPNLLEVGTGVGSFTRDLAPRCSSYTGIEFDAAACDEARRRTNGSARIIQGDARQLPFSNEQFSFVVCLEVLEHLGDWRAGVHEIHRCLQTGGTAIISVPYRRRGGPSKINEHHPYEPGENELVELFQRLFQRVDVEYQVFSETYLMSLARLFHVRRFLGLAQLYSDLSHGDRYATERLSITRNPRGLKIGLIIVASQKN